jgi:hypothetical protein
MSSDLRAGEVEMDVREQRALVLWAGICAVRVVHIFALEYPSDRRPLHALQAASAWARGTIGVREARKAAFAAHAAARQVEAESPAACAAARSAGHAAATAHVPRHARHAAAYAVKAIALAWESSALGKLVDGSQLLDAERRWQRDYLLDHLKAYVFPEEAGK